MSDELPSLDVLVIEDNPGDARLLEHHLNASDVSDVASDASLSHEETLSDGLTELASGGFDVLFLDLGLSETTGLETLDRTLPEASTVPIIVLTGLDDRKVAVEAIKRGAQDYLAKDKLDSDLISRSLRYAIERKKQEQELRTFQEAVENAGHSIYWMDADGRIEYVNPGFEANTGYTAEEVKGRNHRFLKSDEYDDAFYEDIWETIDAGEIWHAEVFNERKNGERHIVDQSIAPIENDVGNIRRFVVINRDITERKEREQRLMVLNRVLRHNLRNDLNVVTGYAQNLRESLEPLVELGELASSIPSSDEGPEVARRLEDGDADPTNIQTLIEEVARFQIEEARENIDRIEENGRKLLTLAEKAHRFENAIQGDDVISSIDVRQLFEDLGTEFREKYPEATIELDCVETAFRGKSKRISVATRELLENALEHNDREAPTVSLEFSELAAKRVAISVVDNGPGIPEMEQEVLKRGEETALLHGSGLGLWTVNWLVTRMGGRVSVSDNEPRGAIVRFELPTRW